MTNWVVVWELVTGWMPDIDWGRLVTWCWIFLVLLALDAEAFARETCWSGGRLRLVVEEVLGFVVLKEAAGLGDWEMRRR